MSFYFCILRENQKEKRTQ